MATTKNFKVKTILNDVTFNSTSARKAREQNEKDLEVVKKLESVFSNYNANKKDKEQLKGFCIGFNVHGVIYAGLFPLNTVLPRIKANEKVSKILQPIGIQQVTDLCEKVCTFDELQEYKQKMRGTDKNDNGTTFQKYLAYLGKQKASLNTNLTDGGDLYQSMGGVWEIKYMTLGTSQGSARLFG